MYYRLFKAILKLIKLRFVYACFILKYKYKKIILSRLEEKVEKRYATYGIHHPKIGHYPIYKVSQVSKDVASQHDLVVDEPQLYVCPFQWQVNSYFWIHISVVDTKSGRIHKKKQGTFALLHFILNDYKTI